MNVLNDATIIQFLAVTIAGMALGYMTRVDLKIPAFWGGVFFLVRLPAESVAVGGRPDRVILGLTLWFFMVAFAILGRKSTEHHLGK